jgi:hypothetical protein
MKGLERRLQIEKERLNRVIAQYNGDLLNENVIKQSQIVDELIKKHMSITKKIIGQKANIIK